MPFKQFRPASQALHNSLAIRPLEWQVLDVVVCAGDVLVSLEWNTVGEICCFSAVDTQDFISPRIFISTITDEERWQPLIFFVAPYQHLIERLKGWLLLRLLLFLP